MHTAARGKFKIHHIKRTRRTIKPAYQKANKFIIYIIVGERKAEGIQTAALCGCYTLCLYSYK